MLPPVYLKLLGDRPQFEGRAASSLQDLTRTVPGDDVHLYFKRNQIPQNQDEPQLKDRRHSIASLSRQIGDRTFAQLHMSASTNALDVVDGVTHLRWEVCSSIEDFLDSLRCLSVTLNTNELTKLCMRASVLHTNLTLHLEAAKLKITLEDRMLLREISTQCRTVQLLMGEIADLASVDGEEGEAQRQQKLTELCEVIGNSKAFIESRLKQIYKYCAPAKTKATRHAMAVFRTLKNSLLKPILNVPSAIVGRIGGEGYAAANRDVNIVVTESTLKELQSKARSEDQDSAKPGKTTLSFDEQ